MAGAFAFFGGEEDFCIQELRIVNSRNKVSIPAGKVDIRWPPFPGYQSLALAEAANRAGAPVRTGNF